MESPHKKMETSVCVCVCVFWSLRATKPCILFIYLVLKYLTNNLHNHLQILNHQKDRIQLLFKCGFVVTFCNFVLFCTDSDNCNILS